MSSAQLSSDRPDAVVGSVRTSDSAALADDRRSWAYDLSTKMATLPDRQASALRLVYSHQLPFTEVAAWMRATVAEVQALVADGLVQLGRMMESDMTGSV